MESSSKPIVSVQPAATVSETAPHMVASVNYSNANAVSSPPDANRGLIGTAQEQQEVERPFLQLISSEIPNHMLNMSNVPCWEGAGYGQNGRIGMESSSGPIVSVQPAAVVSETAPHMVASVNYSNANAVSSPPDANRGLIGTAQEHQEVERPFLQLISSEIPNHMLNMSNVPCWEGAGYGQNDPMGMSSNGKNKLIPGVSRTVQLSHRPLHGSSSMAKMSQTCTNRMAPYSTTRQYMTQARPARYNPTGQQYGENTQPNFTVNVMQVNQTFINIQNKVDLEQLIKRKQDYSDELHRRMEYFKELGKRY